MTRLVIGPQSKRSALIVSHSSLVKSTGDTRNTFTFLPSEISFRIISNMLTEWKAQVLNGKASRVPNGHSGGKRVFPSVLTLYDPFVTARTPFGLSCYEIVA